MILLPCFARGKALLSIDIAQGHINIRDTVFIYIPYVYIPKLRVLQFAARAFVLATFFEFSFLLEYWNPKLFSVVIGSESGSMYSL